MDELRFATVMAKWDDIAEHAYRTSPTFEATFDLVTMRVMEEYPGIGRQAAEVMAILAVGVYGSRVKASGR